MCNLLMWLLVNFGINGRTSSLVLIYGWIGIYLPNIEFKVWEISLKISVLNTEYDHVQMNGIELQYLFLNYYISVDLMNMDQALDRFYIMTTE